MKKKLRYIINIILIINSINVIRIDYVESVNAFKPLLIYGYAAILGVTFVFIIIRKLIKLEGEKKEKVESIFKALIFVLSVQLFSISIVTVNGMTLMLSLLMIVFLCIDFYQTLNNKDQKIMPPE